MKKLILYAFAVFAFARVNAQGFKAGINLGLPITDAGDAYAFNVTADVNYLWEVAEEFQAGVATDIAYNFGDSIEGFNIDRAVFLTIAAVGRYTVLEKFTVGADLGYALAQVNLTEGSTTCQAYNMVIVKL
jgi:hypothetical protein